MADLVRHAEADLQLATKWGGLAKKAGIVPAEMNEIQAAVIVQTGREIGLQPLQSLRSMSFIRGRVCMTVQLQLALAKRRGVKLEKMEEKDKECSITLSRADESVSCKYTLDDAKKAGLVKEGGAYTKYQKQMLRWRAIGDGLRLIAPDLVMGLLSPEEAESIEEESPFPVSKEGKTETEETATDEEAANEPTPEEVTGAEQAPPEKPKGKETKGELMKRKFDYLRLMGEIKKKIGEDQYYKELGGLGYEKSSDVDTIEEMTRVYKHMINIPASKGDE